MPCCSLTLIIIACVQTHHGASSGGQVCNHLSLAVQHEVTVQGKSIRECWLSLILKCISHKREASRLKKDQVNYMNGCLKEHGILVEGEEAVRTLALVCTRFRDLVTGEALRRPAHFLWLDRRVLMYRLETYVQCGDILKNCIPGMQC